MSGAFDAWLLIVGLVVGAGLTWLVLADSNRREVDVQEEELPSEAAWIASSMADEGHSIDQTTAERVLRLHRTYLASLPPDDPLAEPALAAEPSLEPGRPASTNEAATAALREPPSAGPASGEPTAAEPAARMPAAPEPQPAVTTPPAPERPPVARRPTTDAGPAPDALP